jgi:hypothetical protein
VFLRPVVADRHYGRDRRHPHPARGGGRRLPAAPGHGADRLVEKQARTLGAANLRADWIELGGPAVVNDVLLSGAADIVVAGPPAFLTLWDRTRETIKVKRIAAMSSIPIYLNTRAAHLNSIKDLKPNDKIAVTAVKVSIPAIICKWRRSRSSAWQNIIYPLRPFHRLAHPSRCADRTQLRARRHHRAFRLTVPPSARTQARGHAHDHDPQTR